MTNERPALTMAKCNLCGWNVPYDEIGAALMHGHLWDKHQIRSPKR